MKTGRSVEKGGGEKSMVAAEGKGAWAWGDAAGQVSCVLDTTQGQN